MIRLITFAATLAVASASAVAHPLTPSDLVSLVQIGEATVSHDGRWLVWTQSAEDVATKPTRSLWRLNLAVVDAAPEPLSELDGSEPSAPEFASDGQLYVLARGLGGESAIYRLSMSSARATLVMQAQGLAGFRVSPANDSILVWADRPPHTRSLEEKLATPAVSGEARIYDQLPIRQWNRWADGMRSQLFLIPLRNGARVKGSCAVAPSFVADVPSKPSGPKTDTAWAPDGRALYFSLREAGRIEPLSTDSDIYTVTANCVTAPVDLTVANKASDEMPSVSPDGRWLAWLAASRPGYADDKRVIWLRERATGKVKALNPAWDRSADAIAWSQDSSTLFVTANDDLDHPIFSLDIGDSAIRRLTGRGHATLVAPLADGSIIFAADSLLAPPDLWRRMPDGKLHRLTSANAGRLADVEWPGVSRFTFAGAGHDKVSGLSLRPPRLAPGAKAPTVLVVHGGPQSTLGDAWSARWPLNLALYASHGYGVVSIDFHGSKGHGQLFTDSVAGDWGGKPLVDLQRGLAAAIARFDYLDGNRACAVGASYGGFMMNWIEGHWPRRFRCLVQHDGVFDQRTMAYETDELAEDQWDFGNVLYHTDRSTYERWNPVNAVFAWRTPQLVVTGEQDFRTPSGQAIAAFTALQEQGIPARLLVFPREGHYEVRAANSRQWYEQVFAWIDHWTAIPAKH